MRRGAFVVNSANEESLVTSNEIVFFTPGQAYRITHPCGDGDDCTVFSIAPDAVDQIFDEETSRKTFSKIRDFAAPRAWLLHHRVWIGLKDGTLLETEESLWSLLRSVAAIEGRVTIETRATPAGRAAVRRVQELLAERSFESMPLNVLSDEVGVSPHHLSRLFRSETGVPIHRYQNRLRLREAVLRILEGEADLTSLAFDLG